MNSNLADKAYASKAASVLIASFPNLADRDAPEVMRKLAENLTAIFTGKTKALVKAALDPESGIVGRVEFLTIKAVNDWIDKNTPRAPLPEHRLLPRDVEAPISRKEAARRIAVLEALSKLIRDTTKAKCVGRPDRTGARSYICRPEETLKALEFLRSMRPLGEESTE